MGVETGASGGPSGEEIRRAPEGERSSPRPQVARFLVGSVDSGFWNPTQLITPQNEERIRRRLRTQKEVDLGPQARALVKKEMEARKTQDPTERYNDYIGWINETQTWIDWYRKNRVNASQYPEHFIPTVNEALDILIPQEHQRKGRAAPYDRADANYLFGTYLNTESSDYPFYHARFYEEAKDQSGDKKELAESIIERSKRFIDTMIQGCTQQDQNIDMTTLKERLTVISALIPDRLVYATMAQAFLRLPLEEEEKNRLIEETLQGAQQIPLEEKYTFFDKLAESAEYVYGSMEYQASSKQGSSRDYNQDSYVTPGGNYLSDQNVLQEQDRQLDATLATSLTEDRKQLQANHLSTLLAETSVQLSSEEIWGLDEKLKQLIGEKKIGGLAIVADGMGGHATGETASSLASVLVTDYVIKSYAQEDKEQLLKDAILQADKIIGEINRNKGSDMGTTLVATFTDARGETYGASVGDSRIYKRNKETGEVELLTADNSEVWDLLAYPPEFARYGIAVPSEVFVHPQRSRLAAALQDGYLQQASIHTFRGQRLSQDEQLILCSDGVWEGVFDRKVIEGTEKERVEAILQAINRQFEEDIKTMTRERAAKKAFGRIFKEINLAGLTDESRLAEHLTRDEVLENSGDNTTAVVYSPIVDGELSWEKFPIDRERIRERLAALREAAKGQISDGNAEIIPIKEGDQTSPIDIAYFGWRPGNDYTQIAQSPNLAEDILPVPRATSSEQPYILQFQLIMNEGVPTPAIAYSFQAEVEDDRATGGRSGLSAILLTGQGLTPELALRLVAIDHDGVLRGWLPGQNGGPFNPRGDIPSSDSLNVAALKEYQAAQEEKIYERLQNPAIRQRMVTLLTSLLEKPSSDKNVNQLFMYDTDEPDAHAMLYALLDMVSQSPNLREALGPLTFCTNFGNKVPNNKSIQLNFSSVNAGETQPGLSPKPDVRSARHENKSFGDAAQILIDTFLNADHDPTSIATLLQETGEFTPENPSEWCERVVRLSQTARAGHVSETQSGFAVGDSEIITRLNSGEITEDEMPRLAREIARQTREQGMGFLDGKFPSRLEIDKSEYGAKNQYIGVFDRGSEMASLGVLRRFFGFNIFDSQNQPPNRQALIIAPFGLKIAKSTSQMPTSRKQIESSQEDWSEYTYSMSINLPRDQRGPLVIMNIAVPPTISEKIDRALEKDHTFMDKYFKALYPGYVGSDPNEFITRQPATELMIKDFRNPPDGDITHQHTTSVKPILISYPHEIRDMPVAPANAESMEAMSTAEREGREEIARIVDSITMNGVYGKFPQGTHMQTGHLPDLQLNSGLSEDYQAYSNYPPLKSTMNDQYRWIRQILQDERSSHFLTVQGPPSDGQKLVTYFFPTDNIDKFGRRVGNVFTAFLMPADNADKLFGMIRNNPDMAEIFFQQAAKRLERPEGTDYRHSGVGRIKSKKIVIVPWNVIKLPSLENRTAMRGEQPKLASQPPNQQEMRQVREAIRKNMEVLPYNHGPYGVA